MRLDFVVFHPKAFLIGSVTPLIQILMGDLRYLRMLLALPGDIKVQGLYQRMRQAVACAPGGTHKTNQRFAHEMMAMWSSALLPVVSDVVQRLRNGDNFLQIADFECFLRSLTILGAWFFIDVKSGFKLMVEDVPEEMIPYINAPITL